MPSPEPDFRAILLALHDAGIDFIVVGGVCAVLHGVPISTFDLDLVYSRDEENLRRLEGALAQMAAAYREQPSVSPDAERLDSPGHHLLMTRFGPLDLLGSTIGERDYHALLDHADVLDLDDGISIRVLNLSALIAIKEELGRDRDRAVLPILRRTLAERERSD